MSEKMLPVSMGARRLGCSIDTVYRLIAAGELVCIRTGLTKGYMVEEEEVERFKTRRRSEKPERESFPPGPV